MRQGMKYRCLTNVAVIGEKGESVDEFRPAGASGESVEASAVENQQKEP